MEENFKRVLKLLTEDARYTLTEFALQMPDDCKWSSIQRIVHNKLQFRKVCFPWVPRLLTEDRRKRRTVAAFSYERPSVLKRAVTGDEMWFHHYTLETKR